MSRDLYIEEIIMEQVEKLKFSNILLIKKNEQLEKDLQKAEETLRKIKDLDYRGNREQGSVIAFKYFKEKENT